MIVDDESVIRRQCMDHATIVAHNIAQNRPDSFPPYPPTITTAQMMSI